MTETIGQLSACHIYSHEWLIPNFRAYSSSKGFYYSPEFTIKANTRLQLYGESDLFNRKQFWLKNLYKKPLELSLLKLYVVGSDGSEKSIGTSKNVVRKCQEKVTNYLDGEIMMEHLEPVFLPNGELRLRLQIVFKCDVKYDSIVAAPVSQPTITDDLLRHASNIKDMPFTDFELICDSEVFPVHRFMLAARSSVFEAMFKHKNTLEVKNGNVEVNDVDPKTLRTTLNFIYTDEVSDDDISTDLLAAADKYNLSTLFSKCENRLCYEITVFNAGKYFMTGYLHCAKKLKDHAANFILENFKAVKNTNEFKLVSKDPKALMELLEIGHGED